MQQSENLTFADNIKYFRALINVIYESIWVPFDYAI